MPVVERVLFGSSPEVTRDIRRLVRLFDEVTTRDDPRGPVFLVLALHLSDSRTHSFREFVLRSGSAFPEQFLPLLRHDGALTESAIGALLVITVHWRETKLGRYLRFVHECLPYQSP